METTLQNIIPEWAKDDYMVVSEWEDGTYWVQHKHKNTFSGLLLHRLIEQKYKVIGVWDYEGKITLQIKKEGV